MSKRASSSKIVADTEIIIDKQVLDELQKSNEKLKNLSEKRKESNRKYYETTTKPKKHSSVSIKKSEYEELVAIKETSRELIDKLNMANSQIDYLQHILRQYEQYHNTAQTRSYT